MDILAKAKWVSQYSLGGSETSGSLGLVGGVHLTQKLRTFRQDEDSPAHPLEFDPQLLPARPAPGGRGRAVAGAGDPRCARDAAAARSKSPVGSWV